jgi:hypothetical protein
MELSRCGAEFLRMHLRIFIKAETLVIPVLICVRRSTGTSYLGTCQGIEKIV